MKPLTHAQRLRAADPARHGRRVYDAAYRRVRLDPANDPLEAEAEQIRRSTDWRRVRKYVIAGEPLCRDCKVCGRLTPAVDVDHVVPLVELIARGESSRALDIALLQPLCRSCHSKKTAAELRTTRAMRRAARSTGSPSKEQSNGSARP